MAIGPKVMGTRTTAEPDPVLQTRLACEDASLENKERQPTRSRSLDTETVNDSSPGVHDGPCNRDRTRESREQVAALLMEWDPIGVSGALVEGADEYACMISPLTDQLSDRASVENLAAWIGAQRAEHFGLGQDAAADRALARRLAHWWAVRTATG